MAEETAVDPGETELVPISEATEEDLDAFIEGDTSTLEGEDDQPEEEGDRDGLPKDDQTEGAEDETATEDKPPAEPKQPPAAVDPAEHQKLLAKLGQQELYIKNRSTEIGELRKQLREKNQQLAAGLDEKFAESPTAARKDERQIEANEEQIKRLDDHEGDITRRHEAQKLFVAFVKPEEVDINAMADSLKRNGVKPEMIERFKSDPYGTFTGTELIHLSKQSHAETLLRKVVTYARDLEAKFKKLQGKPEQMLKGVQKALNQNPTLNGSQGGTARKSQRPAPETLATLSDADLEEFLKNSE